MRQTKYCRVPIKQRLFSFNFTFQLSHYSILSFSPLLSSELDFVSRTNRKLFSFRSGYDGGLHSFSGVSSTWDFLRSFSGVSLWERLGGGYLHWFWAFLYSRLVFSKTEVIYVSFSLYCKTRLFTFISLKSREPKRLMVFPERKIVLYLTLCNSYFATSALFPLISHRALLESFL